MDIAIALFEKGFSNERVEEALRHCGSVDEAVKWLSPGTISGAEGSAAAAASGTRRRVVRKVATDISSTSSKGHPDFVGNTIAGSPRPMITSSRSGNWDEEEVVSAPSVASAPAPMSVDAGPAEDIPVVLAIEPRDASEFWAKAAAMWPSITKGILARAPREEEVVSFVAAAPGHSEQAMDEEGMTNESRTPKRGRAESAEELEVAEDDDDDEHSRARSDPKKEEPHSGQHKRPPATPCSADTGQGSSSSSAEKMVDPDCSPQPKVAKLSVSPTSSPHAMQLNGMTETCAICCHDVPKHSAVRLGCGHGWYCATCMLRHAEARLEVGAASVTCPECSAVLAERDLRKMLPDEIIERLLSRSLEQAVSSVADLWACPTPNCPMRVALEPGEEPRFKCTECGKSSCLKCGAQPYHKGLTCEEHAARMRTRDKKFSKDEALLNQWLEETGTKQCPTCRMGVSKQNIKNQLTQYSECHKMLCRNCNTKFCFKCLAVLTESYTCGCTIDAHGFIDPRSGKRLNHLKKGRGKPVGKAAAKCKAKG